MFNETLKMLGMKKSELARTLGVAPATISRWKDSPPRYVMAYLEEKKKNVVAERRVVDVLVMVEDLTAELKQQYARSQTLP